jgi:uncharacterized membrane protein YidH (DUF202 family)
MSDLFWLLRPPYTLLTFGAFLILLAVVYTCIGKAWVRFHRWVYRNEEPRRYWMEVLTYYLVGIVLLGVFLYKIRGHSS